MAIIENIALPERRLGDCRAYPEKTVDYLDT